MKKEHTGAKTKLAIILSAGELFAEAGLEGTSIRTIAGKAGVNIAAINYHFHSKENLYTEVLRYIIENSEYIRIKPEDKEFENIKDFRSQDTVNKIYQRIKERFLSQFSEKTPGWFIRLTTRTFIEAPSLLKPVIEQVLRPEHESIKKIIKRIKPKLSEQEAELAAFSFHGQLTFYIFSRAPILMLRQEEHYTREFLKSAADYTAKSIITTLGLPQPHIN